MDKFNINLRELLTTKHELLPNPVDYNNCIYYIVNLLDGKGYIGQAKWFYGRFVANGLLSHKSSIKLRNTHLYNAIRNYKSRNFKVFILEYNLNGENLNRHEEYWINYYHTYYKDPISNNGYNMNLGGEDRSHLYEALRIKYPKTNGMPYQVIEKGREKLKELYPNTNGAPPEWIESAKRSNKNRSQEAIQKQLNTRRNKYSNNPNFYNGVISKTASVLGAESHSLNSIMRTINKYIKYLKDNNYKINSYNYYNNVPIGKNMWNQHIPRVLIRLDKLKNHSDWTSDMSEVFDNITPNPEEGAKGKNKYIIN